MTDGVGGFVVAAEAFRRRVDVVSAGRLITLVCG
jgi:hypothetical protein